MKRFTTFLFAFILVLSLVACNGDATKSGNTYTAKHAHIYPVIAAMDWEEYSFEIKDGVMTLTIANIEEDTTAANGDAVRVVQKQSYTASLVEKDGYYVLTPEKAYQAVEVTGVGAEKYLADIKESINEAIADPEQSEDKERNQQFLRMYEGETVEVTSLLPQGEQAFSFKIKVNKELGKLTELIGLQGETTQVTYTFTYDDKGVLVKSVEAYRADRRFEADYRADGTPAAFQSVDGEETQNFTCDEEGNITEIE